jgi:hypothetical protein
MQNHKLSIVIMAAFLSMLGFITLTAEVQRPAASINSVSPVAARGAGENLRHALSTPSARKQSFGAARQHRQSQALAAGPGWTSRSAQWKCVPAGPDGGWRCVTTAADPEAQITIGADYE